MFSSLSRILVLAYCCLATRVLAQHVESAPYEVLFFYYAYLHEWETRDGDSSIGGTACRGIPVCSIDVFLAATTKPGGQGGYDGGPIYVRGSLTSVYAYAQRLVRANMRSKIEWDPQKLILGAPADKDVYVDHVQYALNTMAIDRLPADKHPAQHAQARELATQADEALRLMSEINAVYIADEHADWWRENLEGSSTSRYTWVDAKDVYTAWQDSPRQAFDMINLVRTWAYEVPPDLPKWREYLTYKDPYRGAYGYWPHFGYRWQLMKGQARACRNTRPPNSQIG